MKTLVMTYMKGAPLEVTTGDLQRMMAASNGVRPAGAIPQRASTGLGARRGSSPCSAMNSRREGSRADVMALRARRKTYLASGRLPQVDEA
ncbi:MAG: hypothetical protein M1541_03870 [Acidobacteria bacterium]|nr:hypothetical protein [Acidobacteriota bacterium]